MYPAKTREGIDIHDDRSAFRHQQIDPIEPQIKDTADLQRDLGPFAGQFFC